MTKWYTPLPQQHLLLSLWSRDEISLQNRKNKSCQLVVHVGVCKLRTWMRRCEKLCVQLDSVEIMFCGLLALKRQESENNGGPSPFLFSMLSLGDSCEMKVLIIHGLICIYLNCRSGDKHPLFSMPGLFMRLIIIKWDCVGGRVDTGGRVLTSPSVVCVCVCGCVCCVQKHKSPKLISSICEKLHFTAV